MGHIQLHCLQEMLVSARDLDELFGFLAYEAAALRAPAGALQVQPGDEVAVRVLGVEQLVGGRELRHVGEQSRLVERPAIAATRRLYDRRQVRLGDVQARQPHHLQRVIHWPYICTTSNSTVS